MGIRLNKKRRRHTPRFYNVSPKIENPIEAGGMFDNTPLSDIDSDDGNEVPSKVQKVDKPESVADNTSSTNNDTASINVEEKNAELLTSYMAHQSCQNLDQKTFDALKDSSTHKAPSTRKQMFSVLKSKGLYQKFPAQKFKKFNDWLSTPSAGELQCTEEIVSEVNRYLHFSCPEEVNWRKLFDTKCFNNYLIITKSAGLGPDGTKTKIERVMTALKYLKQRKKKLRRKCERARAEYKEWLRPLVKKKKVLRMKNSWREELLGFRLTMQDIDTAVSEDTILNFTKAMEKAMEKKTLSGQEHRVIVDTIITLTLTQESAIRPGAFQFMTLEEFSKPLTYISPTDGTIYNIVFVLNHKTFATHGAIAVPFPEEVWVSLHNYLKYVRPQVNPKAPFQHLVFLNANGKMINQPGKSVTKITKHQPKNITPTKIRHCVATAGAEKLSDVERRAVAKGIGHTMEVHDRVYTDMTIKAIQVSIEAQKKLHNDLKCNKLPGK